MESADQNLVRQSERVKSNAAMKEMIELFNQMANELSTEHSKITVELEKEVTKERLAELSDYLESNLNAINELYDKLKTKNLTGSVKMQTLKAIDMLNRDRTVLKDQVVLLANKDTINKPPSLIDASSHSRKRSILSRSASSVSSAKSSASSLRLKMSESKAALAEKETLLAAQEKEAQLQSEIAQMELVAKLKLEAKKKELARIQLQAEIEAERKKQQIFLDALEEAEEKEEVTSKISAKLMLTPNRALEMLQVTTPIAPQVTPVSAPPKVIFEGPQPLLIDLSDSGTQNLVTREDHAEKESAMASLTEPDMKEVQKLRTLTAALNINNQIAEPEVFRGDPLCFNDWINSFQSKVDGHGLTKKQKLHHLRNYVAGQAKEAISDCFYLGSDDVYDEALAILRSRFGDPYIISESFMTKLNTWPKIANKDAQALLRFSDFLRQCVAAKRSLPDLEVLDTKGEIRKLAIKLPEWLTNRWVRLVQDDKGGAHNRLVDFSNFVKGEATILKDQQKLLAPNTGTSPPTLQQSKREKTQGRSLNTSAKDNLEKGKPHVPLSPRKIVCLICSAEHYASECPAMLKKSMEDRQKVVREKGLCWSCLRTGHRVKDCKKPFTCKTCHKAHPTCLHPPERVDATAPAGQDRSQESTPVQSTTLSSHSTDVSGGLLAMIVPVYVTGANKELSVKTYAMLDTQSDCTFITNELCDELDAPSTKVNLTLSTMTQRDKAVQARKIPNLKIRGVNESTWVDLPPVYSREYIPANVQHIPTPDKARAWPHLEAIAHELHDLEDIGVGLLIGYNCPQALAPIEVVSGKMGSEPFAIRTAIGWSVVGRSNTLSMDCDIGISHRVAVRSVEPQPLRAVSAQKFREEVHFQSRLNSTEVSQKVLDILQQDFQEEQGKQAPYSQDDKKFLSILDGSIELKDGQITMALPLKSTPPRNESRIMAERRFRLLEKKFQKDAVYKEQYEKFMKEVIDKSEAELVDERKDSAVNPWYIPHFGVFHPKKPNKIRVVFDCAAKIKDVCLNDFLLQGPDQMNSLLGVLLRFRKHRIAFTCDIERMFHKFQVHEKQRDYFRFLWKDETGRTQAYRMKVHLFGATSSPGCAAFGLKFIAKEHLSTHPEAAEFLEKNFYVDDGLSSVDTEEQALKLFTDAQTICKSASIRLHKFISNSLKVMDSIEASERGASVQYMDLSLEKLPEERVLGVGWDLRTDEFVFKNNLKPSQITRRGVLSTVASVYDPLGLLAPYVLIGKMILQHTCKDKVRWDDQLNPDLEKKWSQWLNSLSQLENIRVPRCLQNKTGNDQICKAELHYFSDASTLGYGQCTYMRYILQDGTVHCSFILGKARVAPLKLTSIPRLELQAAVLSVKISQILRRELELPENIPLEEHYWTDSQVVLAYIANETTRFHVYVANRIAYIQEHSSCEQWHYVSTADNPADHASRGSYPSDLQKSNWFTGPKFLWEPTISSCTNSFQNHLSPDDPEVKHSCNSIQTAPAPVLLQRMENFSNWNQLLSAITLLRKAVIKKKGKASPESVEARVESQRFVIRTVQEYHYSQELKDLLQGQAIKLNSSISKLDPFLDANGLLRVGGRLKRAPEIPYEEKHPLIIPKSHLATLLIDHFHTKTWHQGKGLTLARIRSAGYWIVTGNRLVASHIHGCVLCRKLRGHPQMQKMADLPEDRLTQTPPFTYVGADCFGPFQVKDRRTICKRYGIIYTCLYSRAVHLEVLEDMSTDSFLNSLRNLIAIRGQIRTLRTDRGSNFIGGKGELQKMIENTSDIALKSFFRDHSIDFITKAPYASHMGGVWERLIRTVRSTLQTMLIKNGERLDTSMLRTLLYEVMAIVNSRPLGVSQEDETSTPLTPNNLLTMKTDVILPPPGEVDNTDVYSRKRWLKVQSLANTFWHRWKSNYLTTLQSRQKWNKTRHNLCKGDVVLLMDDMNPRNLWPLGVVADVKVSSDGLVRTVDVQLSKQVSPAKGEPTTSKMLTRPVSQLIYLFTPSQK